MKTNFFPKKQIVLNGALHLVALLIISSGNAFANSGLEDFAKRCGSILPNVSSLQSWPIDDMSQSKNIIQYFQSNIAAQTFLTEKNLQENFKIYVDQIENFRKYQKKEGPLMTLDYALRKMFFKLYCNQNIKEELIKELNEQQLDRDELLIKFNQMETVKNTDPTILYKDEELLGISAQILEMDRTIVDLQHRIRSL